MWCYVFGMSAYYLAHIVRISKTYYVTQSYVHTHMNTQMQMHTRYTHETYLYGDSTAHTNTHTHKTHEWDTPGTIGIRGSGDASLNVFYIQRQSQSDRQRGGESLRSLYVRMLLLNAREGERYQRYKMHPPLHIHRLPRLPRQAGKSRNSRNSCNAEAAGCG